MSLPRMIVSVACLALATAPAAHALDKNGFYEQSDNPILGTWALSREDVNPNMPIRCANSRLTFAQIPGAFYPAGPHKVGFYRQIIVILDDDHIMLDEVPRCTYQRASVNGSIPSTDEPAIGNGQASPAAPATPPHPMTYEEMIKAIGD